MHTYITADYKTIVKDFQINLANDLIGDYCTHKIPGHVSSSLHPLPLLHFLLKSTTHKRGRCTVYCQSKNALARHGSVKSVVLVWCGYARLVFAVLPTGYENRLC